MTKTLLTRAGLLVALSAPPLSACSLPHHARPPVGVVVSAAVVPVACATDTVTLSYSFCGESARAVVQGVTMSLTATPASVTPSGDSMPCTNGMAGSTSITLTPSSAASISVIATDTGGDSAASPLSPVEVLASGASGSAPLVTACGGATQSASPSVQVTGLTLRSSMYPVAVTTPSGGETVTLGSGSMLLPSPAPLQGTWSFASAVMACGGEPYCTCSPMNLPSITAAISCP
jgi:hypothetical protein